MMQSLLWFSTLLAANIAMFWLPLVPALREWRRRGNGPLHIPADDEAGIGYFASRFRERLASDWDDALLFAAPGTDTTSALPAWHAELGYLPEGLRQHYRIAASEQVHGTARLDGPDQPILLGERLRLVRGTHLLGEVYARRRFEVEGGSVVRAVLCDGDLLVGLGSGILRWAHARSIAVGAGSRVMGRISADDSIVIGPDCRFERISTPRLQFGAGAGEDHEAPDDLVTADLSGVPRVERQRAGARWLCRGDLTLPERTRIDGDLVIYGNLKVGAGCHVRGGLKVHGVLHLGAGSRVDGAMFATGAIEAGEACVLAGPVSSGERVGLVSGCRVGRPFRSTSLVAPTISVAGDCTCYGSIWARRDGHTST